eukprot:80326-Rhodomonas_salina.2
MTAKITASHVPLVHGTRVPGYPGTRVPAGWVPGCVLWSKKGFVALYVLGWEGTRYGSRSRYPGCGIDTADTRRNVLKRNKPIQYLLTKTPSLLSY